MKIFLITGINDYKHSTSVVCASDLNTAFKAIEDEINEPITKYASVEWSSMPDGMNEELIFNVM